MARLMDFHRQQSFRDLGNATTETLTFDVFDMYHPYLVIFGRGFMNKFDAVIRQQFLCMMTSLYSVITKKLETLNRVIPQDKPTCIS
jgi:hypothetical protein